MYANDYMYIGNDALKNESSHSFEYGIQIYGPALRMSASQFYKNSQDVIDWYQENYVAWESINISNVLSSGHSMQLELYPELINGFNFIQMFELGYSYLNIEHNGAKNEYKNISNYLKHQFVLGTTYTLPFNINRSWYIRYEQPINHDNRIIFDTQIQYDFWRFETSLNINNLFDVQYEDVTNVALPGRWMRISLRYNL
jgi:outer membrane receptor protein involved in Fe transport